MFAVIFFSGSFISTIFAYLIEQISRHFLHHPRKVLLKGKIHFGQADDYDRGRSGDILLGTANSLENDFTKVRREFPETMIWTLLNSSAK